MLFRPLLLASCAFTCATLSAQSAQPVSLKEALDRVEANVSLIQGANFHAEMKIAGADDEPEFRGTVSITWIDAHKNRIEVRGPQFHQIRTMIGDQVEERNEGDFYPGWLHGFTQALLDPVFAKSLIVAPAAQLRASRSSNGTAAQACVQRDDRPGGITDQQTWGGICISGGQLDRSFDFNTWMEYSDYRSFHGQQIARRYQLSNGSDGVLVGTLTTLRDPEPAEADAIRITRATPKDQQIAFTFISTGAEQAQLESAKPFEWPPVREGKTDGYMIVKALTDVTGQVRETSRHNSDNPGLEEAGRQAALGYKFKPMLVGGVPAQMEMPLVLHFKTTQGVPLPFLKGAEISKVSSTCHSPILLPKGVGEPGRHYHIKVSVNEAGKRTGESFPDGYPEGDIVGRTVESCNFGVYQIDGKPTYYHVELEFIAP